MIDGPFIKSKNSSHRMMMDILIVLLPIIIFGLYKNGIVPYINGKIHFLEMLYPIIFVFLGGTFTYIIEKMYVFLILKKRGNELQQYMYTSFAMLPGILLSLVLPVNTPIWVLLFGSFMAVVLGKMINGGFGKNIFNPTAIGVLCIATLYILDVDIVNLFVTDSSDKSLINLLFGSFFGTIAETANLFCLVAFIYLSFRKVIKRKIPILYIITVFIMSWVIGHVNHFDFSYSLFQILSGGLLFAAIFVATDSVTSPTTPIGQVIYAIGLGILTVVFRYLLKSSLAIFISILLMNLLVKGLDDLGSRFRGKFLYYSILFIAVVIIALFLALFIGNSYKI